MNMGRWNFLATAIKGLEFYCNKQQGVILYMRGITPCDDKQIALLGGIASCPVISAKDIPHFFACWLL
jgi:hypothetical protein